MADSAIKIESSPSPLPPDAPKVISDDEANFTPPSPSHNQSQAKDRSSSPESLSVLNSPSPSPELPSPPKSRSQPSEAPSFLAPSIPTWKRCGDLEMVQQVAIKEEAVENALNSLREIENSMKQQASQIWSSAKWLERIASIRAAKKECRILCGMLGVTGAGKSSLINAILGLEDLLPCEDEKACTAVICELSWNDSKEPDSAFVAIIDRISVEDWQLELEKFFRDLKDQATNKDGEDGEQDLERDLRIKSTFGKLKCVYPSIRNLEAMKTQSVSSLLTHSAVKDILGKSKRIKSSNLQDFRVAIKPYIDSSTTKEEGSKYSFAQWPLVKLVHLKTKSELLKFLGLVDLPGSFDTNEARGALAASYEKNLAVSAVVSPSSRAASDKPAQDLLGSITKRYLQLENRFSSDHLCFIVTKTDSSIVVPRYIRTNPNVEKKVADFVAKESKYRKELEVRHNRVNDLKQCQAEKDKVLKNMAIEAQKIGAPLMKASRKRKRDNTSASQPENPEHKELKRKLATICAEQKETQAEKEKLGNRLSRVHDRIGELDDALWCLDSKKLAACIQNRNEFSIKSLREDFETVRVQMGEKKTGKPLPVFCISAIAYFDLQNKGKQTLGFDREKDTNIPQLRNFLVGSTLELRNRNADAFLQDVADLEDALQVWAADTTLEYKLPSPLKQAIEEAFDQNMAALAKDLETLNTRTVNKMKTLVENGIFKRMPKNEAEAVAKAEVVVRGWAQRPVVWSTHRCTNRNEGNWTTHAGIEYHWNDELGGLYLDEMINPWRKTFHKSLPGQRKLYDTEVSKALETFACRVKDAATAICPEVQEPLKLWKTSAINAGVPLRRNVENIFDNKIKTCATDAHQLVVPKISEIWKPTYTKCGEAFGKGHFKANILLHTEFIKNTAKPMFNQCSKAIRKQFRQLWDTLPREFSKCVDTTSSQIKEDFSMMMENHTIMDSSTQGGGGICSSKVQLRNELNLIFINLRNAWSEHPAEVMDEDSEGLDDDNISLASFYTEEEGNNEPFDFSQLVNDDDDTNDGDAKDDDAKDGDYRPAA